MKADELRAALAAIHEVPLQPRLIISPKQMRMLRLLAQPGETEWEAAIRLGAEHLRMSVREAAVAAPQMAAAGLDPHDGAVTAGTVEDRTAITVQQWERWQQLHPDGDTQAWTSLHAPGQGFPVVDAADVESTCEYTGELREQCGCNDCQFNNSWFDESYWDAKKDDLVD